MDNGKSFIFGYYNGKFGYYTEESKGADSFVPFRGVGEFDTFVKRTVILNIGEGCNGKIKY